MSFSEAHSQVVLCKYRGLPWEDYSFCSTHPSIGKPCNGFYLSVNRTSPRRSFAHHCKNNEVHVACACPFIQLDNILNPAEQCIGFMRRKCCMLGFVNALLKPSDEVYIAIQNAFDKKECTDCPQKRLMRDCNSLCCTSFLSSCYLTARDLLETYPLEKAVINTNDKAKVLLSLLRDPVSASLNLIGYGGQGAWWSS